MATMTRSARLRAHKQSKPRRKVAGKRAPRSGAGKAGRARARPVRAVKPKARSAGSGQARAARPVRPAAKPKVDNARVKKLMLVFGTEWSKAVIVCGAETHPALAAAVREGLCVLNFAPRPDRMSWISLTHGLSAGSKGRPELLVHWRQRDPKLPVRVLSEAARYVLHTGRALAAGDIIASGDDHALDCQISTLPHWFICAPDKALAGQLEKLGQLPPLVLVVGITDGELQYALKVRPEMADGRKVLLEALRLGQVYPVTDPDRLCMTRRRDFHRIWESAFQTVRDK